MRVRERERRSIKPFENESESEREIYEDMCVCYQKERLTERDR